MFRLKHTDMSAPHDGLRVTSLRRWATDDGGGCEAVVGFRGQRVGSICDEGFGGGYFFLEDPNTVFTSQDMMAYAKACRFEESESGPRREGRPDWLTLERVLGALVDEHDWDQRVSWATANNRVTARLMADGYPVETAQLQGPYRVRNHPVYAAELYGASSDPADVWQVWDGSAWIHLPNPNQAANP